MKNLLIKMTHLLKKDDYNKKDNDCGNNHYLNKKSSKKFNLLINFLFIICYTLFILIIPFVKDIINVIKYYIYNYNTKKRICQYKKKKNKKTKPKINYLETKKTKKEIFWGLAAISFGATYVFNLIFGGWNTMFAEILKGVWTAGVLWFFFIYCIVNSYKNKKTHIVLIILSTILIGLGLTSNILSVKWYFKNEQIKQEQIHREQEFLIEENQKHQEFLIKENKKQQEFLIETELNNILIKFSDYYFDYTKQKYDEIQDDTFNWGTHSFVIKKNDKTTSIEFILLDNKNNDIVESKIRQYN